MISNKSYISYFNGIIERKMAVETRIIRINLRAVEPDKIKEVARVLKEKGIIVYPTDTIYGMGADCLSPEAIKKIYSLKKRKAIKPISVVISDVEDVEKIAVDIPPSFWEIADKFWPGPLTLILKASPDIPAELCGDSRTIGVRLPALPWLRELVREAGVPVTATSANISGEGVYTSVKKIVKAFSGKVEMIVDAGDIKDTRPSTLLDITSGKLKIIREGAFSSQKLKKYVKRSI